ncbi:MAG: SPASM domain-containing protein [Candidatus Omnitrophica bacterium]|nr:SPASM domain-containing protein [Candidatus Omnitrophota bacterium]
MIKKTLKKIIKKIKFSKNRPDLLFLEPTNLCNLNCPFCLVNVDKTYKTTAHDQMRRPFGYMDLVLFDKILDDARDFGIKTIYLEFWGESFLHPQIGKMLEKTSRMKFKTSIFTNGLLLDSRRMGSIPDNVDRIIISIDGASAETYEQNRIGGNFDRVWHNMVTLNQMCVGTKTNVIWQFVVMRNNEYEIERARQLAKEHNLQLRLKTFNPSVAERVTSLKQYARKKPLKPCTSIYRQFAVLWNGDIVPCCQDPDGRNVLGNIKESSFGEIWNSEKYRIFRQKVKRAVICPEEEPLICKTCSAYQ